MMLPWAEARVKENQDNLHKNDPMVACMPPGVPRVNLGGSRAMPHPFKIVQTPTLVVLLYETSTNQTFRQVFLDGRPFPDDMDTIRRTTALRRSPPALRQPQTIRCFCTSRRERPPVRSSSSIRIRVIP